MKNNGARLQSHEKALGEIKALHSKAKNVQLFLDKVSSDHLLYLD